MASLGDGGPKLVYLTEAERDWACTAAGPNMASDEVRRQVLLELRAEGYLKARAPIPPTPEEKAQVQEVYDCWRQELHPTMPEKPSKDRFKVILQALHAGYISDQLIQIVRWAKRDPWSSGRDPKTNGQRLDDLFTLIGSPRKIDRHLLRAQHTRGLAGREAGVTLMPDATKAAEARRL